MLPMIVIPPCWRAAWASFRRAALTSGPGLKYFSDRNWFSPEFNINWLNPFSNMIICLLSAINFSCCCSVCRCCYIAQWRVIICYYTRFASICQPQIPPNYLDVPPFQEIYIYNLRQKIFWGGKMVFLTIKSWKKTISSFCFVSKIQIFHVTPITSQKYYGLPLCLVNSAFGSAAGQVIASNRIIVLTFSRIYVIIYITNFYKEVGRCLNFK